MSNPEHQALILHPKHLKPKSFGSKTRKPCTSTWYLNCNPLILTQHYPATLSRSRKSTTPPRVLHTWLSPFGRYRTLSDQRRFVSSLVIGSGLVRRLALLPGGFKSRCRAHVRGWVFRGS